MFDLERIGRQSLQGMSLVSKSLLSLFRSLSQWKRPGKGRKHLAKPARNQCPAHALATDQEFRRLLENLPRVAVQGYDKHRRVVYWNKASEALYGYCANEAIGRNLEDLLIPDAMRDEVIEAHRAWVEEGIIIPAGPLILKRKTGAPVTVYSHHIMLGTEANDPLMFCIDVNERSLHTVQDEFLLVEGVDTLTRLPGQRGFESELSMAMRACSDKQSGLAILAIDIEADHAPAEVDHATMMATVVRHLVAEDDMERLAHYGRDRFVMFIPDIRGDNDVLDRVESIFKALGKNAGIRDQALSASIGICLFPDHEGSASALVQRAGLAAKRARRAGPNRYWFFDQRLYAALHRQHRLVQDLKRSLDDGEFVLRYRSGSMNTADPKEGLEVWLQWAPRNGEAPFPLSRWPADTESSLLTQLGDWLLLEACLKRDADNLGEPAMAEIRAALDELVKQLEVGDESMSSPTFDARPRSALIEAIREGKQYTIRLEAGPPCQEVIH